MARLLNQVLEGDCLEVMREIPDGSVDMVLCDLPYGTTACKWDTVIPLELLWEQYERVTKPCAAIVLTASQPFTSALVMSKPDWFRCEWIWHKSNGGGFLNANRHPLKKHESILVFARQSPRYNPQKTVGKPYKMRRATAGETTRDQSVAGWVTESDGMRFPTSVQYVASETGLHPTQKPVALFEYLIRTYTNDGETVLDNCAGSGTTAVAAIRTGRDFICIDKEPKYVQIARDRIEKETSQGRLFRKENVGSG